MKTFLIITNSLCGLYWIFNLCALIAGYLHPTNVLIGCGFALSALAFVNLLIRSLGDDK